MRVKLRCSNEEKEVNVSKCNLTSVLIAEASKVFGITLDHVKLIYRGSFLKGEEPLLVQKIKEGDVLIVFNNEMKPKNDGKSSKTMEVPNKSTMPSGSCKSGDGEEAVKSSDYFQVNDALYYQSDDHGDWREAKLVAIFKNNEDGTTSYEIFDGARQESLKVQLSSLRNCSWEQIAPKDLMIGEDVLAYTAVEGTEGWFRVKVTKVMKLRGNKFDVRGDIIIRDELEALPNTKILYVHNLLKFTKTLMLRSEWSVYSADDCYGLIIPCKHCMDCATVLCKECSCSVCGGKHDEELQVICDECEQAFHIQCLTPALASLPTEPEWFCSKCSHSDSKHRKKQEKKRKEQVRAAKASMEKGGKNWGKGGAVAGVSDRFSVVPDEHIGAIPGVPSGRLWDTRVHVSSYGVHRPPVGGICGKVNFGAQSVCFSGGYDGDIDEGETFIMSGSGGRDLSGNKRTEKQSFAQKFTNANIALAQSCYAKVDDKNGGDAGANWKKGMPIRVIRGYKLAKRSKYAPEAGYRYDGLYKVVKYYQAESKGFIMWKYELKRDDEEPAPWTKEGKIFMNALSIGHLEIKPRKEKADSKSPDISKSQKSGKKTKRKSNETKGQPVAKKQRIQPYEMPGDLQKMISKDTINKKAWANVLEAATQGYLCFIKSVAVEMNCTICLEVVKTPCSLPCCHNYCLDCLLKDNSKKCPICKAEEVDYKACVNQLLQEILEKILPGYNRRVQPKPYHMVKVKKEVK